MTAYPGQPALDGKPLTIEVTLTLTDYVDYTKWLLGRRKVRVRRLRNYAILFLLSPLIGIPFGFFAISSSPLSPRWAANAIRYISLFSPEVLRTLAIMCVVTWTHLALFLVLVRLLRRWPARRRMALLLRERPGVDPNDPECSEKAIYTFSETTVSVRTSGMVSEMEWITISEFVETPLLIILRLGAADAHILPKRDLKDGQLSILRTILEKHVNQSRQQGHGSAGLPQRS